MSRINAPIIITAIMLLLFSCKNDEAEKQNKKAQWIENAFISLESGRYPGIKAISWWHENFDNSLLKVNSSPESLEAYKKGIKSSTFVTTATFAGKKLSEPAFGCYHAAYPDFGGTEDVVAAERIESFELLVGKKIVWAYFSNNWYDSIQFPLAEVNIIHSAGSVPFIRIMPRSNFDEGGPDPYYSLQKIIDGDYDAALTQWASDAANTNMPLLVEFGTEVNGSWFPWNGQYNGAGETNGYGNDDLYDGAERFRDAFRHIIDICKANGTTNITWFFHVNAYSEPDVSWNTIRNYYPGDNYIDWLGVSVYGPQERNEDYQEFSEIMDDTYTRLTQLSNNPIAVLEFAITEID